jgi:hypothetical protein
MRERYMKIISIFVLLTVVLFQYQNCGSQNQKLAGDSYSNDPEMGVINPINIGSIQFLQSKTEIDDSVKELTAYGVCSQDQQGALLSWKLIDEETNILSTGKSLCNQGTFEIVSSIASSIVCGSSSKLTAYLGSQEKTELLVEKVCN